MARYDYDLFMAPETETRTVYIYEVRHDDDGVKATSLLSSPSRYMEGTVYDSTWKLIDTLTYEVEL